MTSYGETASTVASAAALEAQDWIYPQYREMGAFLWKGVTAEEFIDQCMGNVGDEGKGRQMPIHLGKKSLNIVTVSSPLSNFGVIQQRRSLRLREQDTPLELRSLTRLQPHTLGKGQPQRGTSTQP